MITFSGLSYVPVQGDDLTKCLFCCQNQKFPGIWGQSHPSCGDVKGLGEGTQWRLWRKRKALHSREAVSFSETGNETEISMSGEAHILCATALSWVNG